MTLRAWLGGRREHVLAEPWDAEIPAGQRIYAIGDVHGRYDLMLKLLAKVAEDSAARGAADVHVVMLGDLVDRGPDSAEVLDYLLTRRPDFATFHFLMGNHEEAMLKSLEKKVDPRETGWFGYGGIETLESYLVPEDAFTITGWLLSEELRLYIPKEHIQFIQSFRDSLRFGDYLFVHAGIRPHVAIEKQRPSDLRWIREEFLDDESDHGVMVVHGHTITSQPDFRLNRIGIDTGAYRSGVLTAIGLEGTERWILSTSPELAGKRL